jgi:broad specificity phosphatase PhoE
LSDPIYKTKDGQQVTHQQLLASGYDEDRISKGLGNGVLNKIGDTNAPGQMFKTNDGQSVSYEDLVGSGYSEDRINKGVQNGILTAAEPGSKKKVGSVGFPTSSGSEPSLQLPGDVINMDKQAQELAKKMKVTGNDMSGVEVMGPDEEAIGQANELNKKIQAQGYKPGELSQEFKDFPEEAFTLPDENGVPKFSKENLLQLRKDNPIEYHNTLNNLKTTFQLANAGGTAAANDFNRLHGESEHLPEFEAKIKGQQDIINTHLSGEDRDKALDRLKDTAAQFIDPTNSSIVKDYNEHPELSGKLDINQYTGLKTLQLFDKPKYDQAVKALGTDIAEKQIPEIDTDKIGVADFFSAVNVSPNSLKSLKGELNSSNTINQQIGKEAILKNLDQIGRNNALVSLNKKQYDIDNQWKSSNDENEKANLQAQYIINQNQIDKIKEAQTGDLTKYPLTSKLELDNLSKELTGHADYSVAGYGLRRFGKGFEGTGNTLEDIFTGWFGSDAQKNRLDLQRMGETQKFESDMYLPENLKSTGSDIIPKFSKQLQEKGNKIYDDGSLSDSEKNVQLRNLVSEGLKNGEVDFITNPNSGKGKNFLSKATMYGNAGLIGDIASFAAQSYGLGALGASKMLAASAPMFTSTYDDFYSKALLNGSANPEGEALVHASIMALAGMVNPDINIVKRSVGVNTPLGKIIAGVDEGTWNKVLSDNKPLLNKFTNAAKSVGKEAIKMVGTYGVGTSIASDLADKGFFNKDISGKDIVNHAVESGKQLVVNSAGLLGLNAITNFKSVPLLEKAKLWEAADNKDLTFQQIDEAVKSNQLSEAQGEQRKKVINDISKLVESVPTQKSNGKPLTDKERINYLYNLYIKSKADELKKSSPEQQKELLEGKKAQADVENNAILEGKKQKLIQIEPGEEKMFTYDSEKDIPEVLRGTKPIKTEETEGEGGKKIKLTYTGKQLIDAGMAEKPRIRVSAEQVEAAQPKRAITPTGENIKPQSNYVTMEMGNDEGKPETKAARAQMKERFLEGNTPMDGDGGKGETGREFVGRVIPQWENDKNAQPENTTVITHSSVLKAIKTWENPKTWEEVEKPTDAKNISDEQWHAFAKEYNKESTDNGDLETFKGKNGDIHVIRHGETEDNAEHNFRSAETNLTGKGVAQGKEVAQQLKEKTGGNVPQIISSELPRAIHTANIIHEILGGKEENKTEKPEQKTSYLETERNKEIDEAHKPELPEIKEISDNDLVKSKDRAAKINLHDEITDKIKKLHDIVNCLWG